MTDGSLETSGKFELNEAGAEFFEEHAELFEKVVERFRKEDYDRLLADPSRNLQLSRDTHQAVNILGEHMVRKIVFSIVQFANDPMSGRRPDKFTGSVIRAFMKLGTILNGNFPDFTNTGRVSSENILLNRLSRIVRSVLLACLMKTDHQYKRKKDLAESSMLRRLTQRKENLPTEDDMAAIKMFDMGIGWDLKSSIVNLLSTPELHEDPLAHAAMNMHGLREFLRSKNHKMEVPQIIDIEALRKVNARIFETIREDRSRGEVPLMINAGQDVKVLKGTVTEMSPIRNDTTEYGEYMAHFIIGDKDHLNGLEILAAEGLPSGAKGSQTTLFPTASDEEENIICTAIQFFLRRDGEIDGFETNYRALKILLGEHRYEILRTSVLVEVAQAVCHRQVLQNRLGDIMEFNPERKTGLRGQKRPKGGVKKTRGLKSFPTIWSSMVKNAEYAATGERGPSDPHKRLLPANCCPSKKALKKADAADFPTKEIPREILEREDVKIKIDRAPWQGYAVSWYEDPGDDNLRALGYKERVDFTSENIEEKAAKDGTSIGRVVDELLAHYKNKKASVRFYTYVSSEEYEPSLVRGQTEAGVRNVIERVEDHS
ncbi:MAG: hypothetical protein ABH856_03055 [Patescibacteria group bacterium]|nr:hypothetical protein [Patescibacteria group bacterium]